MEQTLPLTQDLVLIGGGHTHALVLRMWAMNPLPGAALTVIDPGPTVAYSGMLPGFVAGHYSRAQLDIDLVRLARIAGARLIIGRATGIDRDGKKVLIDGQPPVGYDVLSIDIGIHTTMPELAGFAQHGVPAKPLGPFAAAWDAYRQNRAAAAVIGGGIAGAELAMAMAHAIKKEAPVHLIDRGPILDEIADDIRPRLLQELSRAGVTCHAHADVVQITKSQVHLANGDIIDAGFVTGAAGPRPYGWLADTGLDLQGGYVTVGPSLQSSDADIFAAGDCAYLSHAPRPKAGVYAVRAAPVLAHNLRVALAGRGKMKPFKPQKDYLKLVSLGRKRAMAEKGGRSFIGRSMWLWKDRIDRKFMRQFSTLAPMGMAALPRQRAQGVDAALDGKALCSGCGAKVGKTALTRALASLPAPLRDDLVPLPGDDAAVLLTGGARQVLTTDHLSAVTQDEAAMARIAAVHALGDIWAMGAVPQAAVAQITLPRMGEPLQERRMERLLAAAQEVLDEAGAALVGGHSTMGTGLTIGFSLTGLCEDDPITLSGAQSGDALILTKPIGSGTVLAAEMAGKARGQDVAECFAWMQRGQSRAAELLRGAHAMTDVTGFGLAGHLWGMCDASAVSAQIELQDVPVMAGAVDLATAGVRSSIWASNRAAVPVIDLPKGDHAALLFDPQTGGGLLAAVPDGEAVLSSLRDAGCFAVQIGTIGAGPARIVVR